MTQGDVESAAEPAWQIATLFPDQGDWWEEDYLRLPGNRLIELADGSIEILPMPTLAHQRVLVFLSVALYDFARQGRCGEVLCAPFPVRLAPGKFRMPDVAFMFEPG
jgi:Uma2 family endonuclease